MRITSTLLILACSISPFANTIKAAEQSNSNNSMLCEDHTVSYRTITIDNVKMFYREAGPQDGTTILMLHGFPSSSRMFAGLIPQLADRYHVIAPDYPGFGHSDAPPPEQFTYTFDHLADIIQKFTDRLQIERYVLLMQDYGGPVGFRLALAKPEKVIALIIQNAVAHEEGLSTLWEPRRAFWRDRAANEEAVRKNLTSFAATRQRHVGNSPHPERIDPDTWTDEYAFLTRPGMDRIQLELFYDYQTNVASYPKWQAYLREHRPRTLVVWGKYDPSFTVAGALAYGKDVPDAEIHLLNAGHFALDEEPDLIRDLIRRFLDRLH
ncbi:MAG: alpha/beta hydrolase [Chthoniobacterales bacterium]